MDIDLSALRMLESEKDISMETSVKAIEDALLVAYHRTEGAAQTARVKVDRRSGHVTVWAAETAADGTVAREYDDTPDGFGRIAATTARQVILQRLRDVEDEITFGEYAGHEGDIVAGVIQQGKDPRTVLVDGALREVRYDDVERAAVVVEFRHPPEEELTALGGRPTAPTGPAPSDRDDVGEVAEEHR